ncbi:mitochondrial import inner membrane translocase subunit tim22 [Radiomyces spectabilis]|uniref:mitochondrial import inner membrane translocase subunit tim22 n=1 Tax=Radiomyces spectabilis TaxID=64574 RepID=UPI00221F28FB|nr:mitochondrial import inner membrane translocase subunit tim22 [Radiomyces spectabilis]KAI8393650.1 mitochondrial import inner membrane translocase subunit tim22 [Radiomyces spectabilis]
MASPMATAMGGNPGIPEDQQQTIKMIQGLMESCPVKTGMAGGAGFVMGGAFGLFMSSFEYAGPTVNEDIVNQSTKQQLKHALKDMGSRSWSMAKNFAVVGAIYSGSECCIESYRAKNDLYNSAIAGCFTGGVLAAKAGPQATMFGCAGFAAFSTAIDMYMRRD